MPAHDKTVDRWYRRSFWQRLRLTILNRDPVCTICGRRGSVIVDHKVPHKGDWSKFCDPNNCRGVCKPCHDEKTAREDGGFGHVPKPSPGPTIARTGEPGRQFVASQFSNDQLDAALGDQAELDELLKDI